MTREFLLAALHFCFWLCLAYLVLHYVFIAALMLYSSVEVLIRKEESRGENYNTLSTSRFTIPVSVIAAAYNERVGIVGTVRSLLRLDYPEFEVIVVNDGSTDDTMRVLRDAFELVPYEIFYRKVFPTERLRGIYRSRADARLIVIDKENGGKADALNCGINLSRYRYICCVDADAVYMKNALLKGMRLVIQDPAHVVGVTASVGICHHPEKMDLDSGQLPVDRRLISNYQHLDYMRSFLLARIAWSRLNFMLCVIGAFQIWRRDAIVEVGGFSSDFTCEDIEMTFRMQEFFLRKKIPAKILALPDTIGVTEGPDRFRSLISQRARWQRVIMETFWHYRRMFFNPTYRTVGMFGMPFYFLSEVLAPFMQALSVLTLIVAALLGVLIIKEFLIFVLIMGLLIGVATNVALLFQDDSFRPYTTWNLIRFVTIAPLDMILYRPILFWAQAKGAFGFFRGHKHWDRFERNRRQIEDGRYAT